MKFEKQIAEMQGAFSAIFTPFDASGAINFDMLTAITEYQLAHGLKGFFVTGSTGEGLLLSYEERLEVIRHVINDCRDRATVIAHVGHPSTEFAAKLAKESADSGADWIGSVAPIYHGTTFEGAMRHYENISNASDLPFMIYSLGGIIDSHRDTAFFDLPNVCGLKYTGANFYSVQQLARFVDQPIALMSGFDEQFVAGQSFGFRGGIGTTFNFGPQFYADIHRHYHAGNIEEASRLQAEINKVTELIAVPENWSCRKAIMKYIGFDCGAYRLPYAPLTDEEEETLFAQLDALNILHRNQ